MTDGAVPGMAVGGLGFGMYMAVDLALVADDLPDKANAAKDLGVVNIAPAILAIGSGSYGVLYAVAGSAPLSELSRSCLSRASVDLYTRRSTTLPFL